MSKRKWWRIAAVVWMAIIFCFTQLPYFTGNHTAEAIQMVFAIDLPGVGHVNINEINLIIRKATHMTVFGILAFLLVKSLETYRYAYLYSWVITFVYAITDEYHQSLVPDRTPSFRDVLFDSFGAALVLSLTLFFSRNRRKGKAD